MNRTKLLLATLAISGFAYGQMGINNALPKATLDITAKQTNATTAEGLIAPRLTGNEIQAKDARYNTDQTGTLIYATSAVTAPGGTKTVNITAAGYYFFNGSVWIRIAAPAVPGDTTDDAWVNGSAQVLLGTLADGTARPSNAAFRIADTGATVLGSTNVQTPYKLAVVDNSGVSALGLLSYGGAATNKSYIDLTRIGGTEAAPANLPNNTTVGNLFFNGRIGGSLQPVGSITSIYTGDGTVNKAKLFLSSAGASTTNQMVLSDDGNVGIGTAAPTNKLQISGGDATTGVTNATVNNMLNLTNVLGGTVVQSMNTGLREIRTGINPLYQGNASEPVTPVYSMVARTTAAGESDGGVLQYDFKNKNLILAPPIANQLINNVGIGTSAPTSKLQVVGLPAFPDVAAAQASTTITPGAFYRLNAGTADAQSIVRIKY